MSIQARGILLAVFVLFSVLCLTGAGPNLPVLAESSGESSVQGPVESGSMLVEAFVVEVNLPALTKAGVSPIGGRPHGVAVADILTCLDGGQAQVIGGSKVAAHGSTQVGVQARARTYVRQEAEASRRAYSPFEGGKKLTVETEPATESAVSVQFKFTNSRFTQKQQATDVPPDTEDWDWSGSIVLQPGEPQIAGAVQDGETAVFLLLVVNVQSQ